MPKSIELTGFESSMLAYKALTGYTGRMACRPLLDLLVPRTQRITERLYQASIARDLAGQPITTVITGIDRRLLTRAVRIYDGPNKLAMQTVLGNGYMPRHSAEYAVLQSPYPQVTGEPSTAHHSTERLVDIPAPQPRESLYGDVRPLDRPDAGTAFHLELAQLLDGELVTAAPNES